MFCKCQSTKWSIFTKLPHSYRSNCALPDYNYKRTSHKVPISHPNREKNTEPQAQFASAETIAKFFETNQDYAEETDTTKK